MNRKPSEIKQGNVCSLRKKLPQKTPELYFALIFSFFYSFFDFHLLYMKFENLTDQPREIWAVFFFGKIWVNFKNTGGNMGELGALYMLQVGNPEKTQKKSN